MIWGDVSYYILFIWLGLTFISFLTEAKELKPIAGIIAIYLGLGVLLSTEFLLAILMVFIGFYQVWSYFD